MFYKKSEYEKLIKRFDRFDSSIAVIAKIAYIDKCEKY